MTIITTGVKTPNNTIVARQDLREFVKDKYLLNLYLLATQSLQKTDQQDILSYYQISGIHGRYVTQLSYSCVGLRLVTGLGLSFRMTM